MNIQAGITFAASTLEEFRAALEVASEYNATVRPVVAVKSAIQSDEIHEVAQWKSVTGKRKFTPSSYELETFGNDKRTIAIARLQAMGIEPEQEPEPEPEEPFDGDPFAE